jgi:hypothetical protein
MGKYKRYIAQSPLQWGNTKDTYTSNISNGIVFAFKLKMKDQASAFLYLVAKRCVVDYRWHKTIPTGLVHLTIPFDNFAFSYGALSRVSLHRGHGLGLQ